MENTKNNSCCGEGPKATKILLFSLLGVSLLFNIVGLLLGSFDMDMMKGKEYSMNMNKQGEMMGMDKKEPMKGMDHSAMDMSDPMSMSMADMGAMLEGKTGDELDRAFLEGMIPHHQGAIDMAKVLVNAKHPELKKMGQDIIIAQQAEIDQMNKWLSDWGYVGTGTSMPKSSDGEAAMREHCEMMPPRMAGCEKYK